jgi:hypothetical protein
MKITESIFVSGFNVRSGCLGLLRAIKEKSSSSHLLEGELFSNSDSSSGRNAKENKDVENEFYKFVNESNENNSTILSEWRKELALILSCFYLL